MPIAINLTGKKFGRLTALKDVGKNKRGRVWECMCDCGKFVQVISTYLTSMHTRSCGCLQPDMAKASGEKRRTHGHTSNKNKQFAYEYHTWASMKNRCYRVGNASYKNYGARGITVCDRWLNSFENFYADMGPRPSNEHSLDRIDTNSGYSPENCRWADKYQQAQTRTNVRAITAFGKTQSAAAWERDTGIPSMVIRNRLDSGWDVEKTLTTQKRGIKRAGKTA